MTPFGMIELAVKELIETRYEPAAGKVGGDLSYEAGDGLYVWLGLVDGSANQNTGSWVLDIDFFGDDYGTAMRAALALEAALLDRPYGRTDEMRIDSITQNEGPAERPWDDEAVFRIGATYVFTARRSG